MDLFMFYGLKKTEKHAHTHSEALPIFDRKVVKSSVTMDSAGVGVDLVMTSCVNIK